MSESFSISGPGVCSRRAESLSISRPEGPRIALDLGAGRASEQSGGLGTPHRLVYERQLERGRRLPRERAPTDPATTSSGVEGVDGRWHVVRTSRCPDGPRAHPSRRSTALACLISRITMHCVVWIGVRLSCSSAITAYAVSTPRSTSAARGSAIFTIFAVASTPGRSSSIPPCRATSGGAWA